MKLTWMITSVILIYERMSIMRKVLHYVSMLGTFLLLSSVLSALLTFLVTIIYEKANQNIAVISYIISCFIVLEFCKISSPYKKRES